PHYNEWMLREESWKRLQKYLSRKMTPMKVLEVGCGNGWLSQRLSDLSGCVVTGIDINAQEINQAKRVFDHIGKLKFLQCRMNDEKLDNEEFSLIVFAASMQYFPSLQNVLREALDKLAKGGEIHIIDTAFYTRDEA